MSASETETDVLAVVRDARMHLPERDSPLLDRLFALECAARGGRAVAAEVERYRDALREAEWEVAEHWEPDVPHAAIVGQALSSAAALDTEPPAEWAERLQEAVDALGKRQTRLGLGNDPALMAAVLRGLDGGALAPPAWLMRECSELLARGSAPAGTAELAEALARHRTGEPMVMTAVAAVFSGPGLASDEAAYARWWLAARYPSADHHVVAGAVEAARLQALTSSHPTSGRPAAMVMEAAALAADDLIIKTPAEMSATKSRSDRRVRASRAIYRGLLVLVVCVWGLFELHDLAHAVASVVAAVNEQPFRRGIAAVLAGGAVYAVTSNLRAVARAYDRRPPDAVQIVEVLGALVVGVAAAAVA